MAAIDGPRRLKTDVKQQSEQVLVFAACMPDGNGITLAFANFDGATNVSISLPSNESWGASPYGGDRQDYILSADGSLSSRFVRLNGGDWLSTASELVPRIVSNASGTVELPGTSAGFVVLAGAGGASCA